MRTFPIAGCCRFWNHCRAASCSLRLTSENVLTGGDRQTSLPAAAHELLLRHRERELFDELVGNLGVLVPRLHRQPVRVLEDGILYPLHQPLPQVREVDVHLRVSVGARVAVHPGRVRVGAHAAHDLGCGGESPDGHGRRRRDHRLLERYVNVLPQPGSAPGVQRHQGSECPMYSADGGGGVTRCGAGEVSLVANVEHPVRHGLRDEVAPLPERMRPRLPERRNRRHDDRGIRPRQILVTEADARQIAGREVFDHNVGAGRQRQDRFPIRLILHIQNDAALVRVEVQEDEASIHVGDVSCVRGSLAGKASAGRLDADDVRPEVRQQAGGVLPKALRQIENLERSQCSPFGRHKHSPKAVVKGKGGN